MILVDSSVWIAQMRGELHRPAVRALNEISDETEILVGDLILLEVLQGARDDRHARRIEASFRQMPMASMLSTELARAAAARYRQLRGLGVTVRKSADLIIASFCLEAGHMLLHQDRDFDPFVRLFGLRVLV